MQVIYSLLQEGWVGVFYIITIWGVGGVLFKKYIIQWMIVVATTRKTIKRILCSLCLVFFINFIVTIICLFLGIDNERILSLTSNNKTSLIGMVLAIFTIIHGIWKEKKKHKQKILDEQEKELKRELNRKKQQQKKQEKKVIKIRKKARKRNR